MSLLMDALKKAAQGKQQQSYHVNNTPAAHETNASVFTDGNAALCLADEQSHHFAKQTGEVSEFLLDSEALEKELESIVAGSHERRKSAELESQSEENIADPLVETHLSLELNLIDNITVQDQSSPISDQVTIDSEHDALSFRMDDDVNHSQLDINMMSIFGENATEESPQAEESTLNALQFSVEENLSSRHNHSEKDVEEVKPIETLQEDKPAIVTANSADSADTVNRATADRLLQTGKQPVARQKSKYRLYGLLASVVMLVIGLGGGYVYYEINASNFTPTLALPTNIDLNNRAPLLVPETTVDAPAENSLASSQADESITEHRPSVSLPKVTQSNKATASPKPSIAPKTRVQQSAAEISSEKKSPSKLAAVRPNRIIATKKSVPVARQEVMVDPKASALAIKSERPDSVHTLLLVGYNAYQRSDMVTARSSYQAALQRENKNRDAMLGLAAIALRERNYTIAQDYYTQLLQANPADNVARGGLVSLLGELAPLQAESELKTLLNQEPSAAYLHFTLGNIYVSQSRWADAQQAFFKAYSADKNNADYIYNLAVSLDFLGEHKTALNYYREALILAERNIVSFNLSAVEQRIHSLIRIVGG